MPDDRQVDQSHSVAEVFEPAQECHRSERVMTAEAVVGCELDHLVSIVSSSANATSTGASRGYSVSMAILHFNRTCDAI